MRTVALGVVICLLGGDRVARADTLSRLLAAADEGGSSAAPAPPPDDLAAWAGPAQPTTLPDLLQHAVRQAPSLASARLDIAIAEAQIQQTWARDDWRLGAQLTAARQQGFVTSGFRIDSSTRIALNTEISRTLPTGGTVTLHATSEYQNFSTMLGDTTSWFDEIGGTIAQPLLRGRGRELYDANERKANLARDAAALGKRLAAIQTIQQVIAAYWDLVLAERQVAITQASLMLARERLRITTIGAEGGKIPRSEIPAVQQIIATREEDVLNGELLVLDRSIAVRRAVGMPIGAGALGLRVGTDLDTRDATWDLGQLTERAYAASPELAQLAKQDASTRIDIEVTENGLLPSLEAALTIAPTGQDERPGAALKNMVTLDSIRFFTALRFQHSLGQEDVRGRAREARETRRKISVSDVDIRAQIAQAMARAVAQLEVARRRVALSRRAIDLANENIKIETDRFNLGKATNFDILNRQEELRQAELRKAQAMIDWHKAETVVAALTGDILPTYGISVD